MKVNTPKWVKDAVFYQILPDRFFRSSKLNKDNFEQWGSDPISRGFQGGDLYGVIEKIPYLKSLGINAIYLNPIFKAGSYHRYNTFDYYQVDPLLGGNDALKKLINIAHKNKIKIILDGVFNHVGRGFYQFNHILECGEKSPFKNWFKIEKYPLNAYSDDKKANYWSWWGIKDLPKLNIDNTEVRKFIFDVAKYWVNFGIDGWRLDVPSEINEDNFWKEFREVVKKENKNAYIVGEIWVDEDKHHAKRWLKGDQFDAIMNYGFTVACIGFFVSNKFDVNLVNDGIGKAKIKSLSASEFAERMEAIINRYSKEIVYSQYNLLDSHDTARFLTLANGDVRILKLAVLMMMTYIGAPSVYYGDEIGLDGGKEPECRKAFSWDKSDWNTDLNDYYKKVISIRKKYKCLRHGEYKTVYAENDMYVFMRYLKDQKILVIINNSESDNSLKLSLSGFNKKCLLTGNIVNKVIKAKSAHLLLSEF